jgi:hypothetical protein
MFGYIDVNQHKERSPKVWQIRPETSCVYSKTHVSQLFGNKTVLETCYLIKSNCIPPTVTTLKLPRM